MARATIQPLGQIRLRAGYKSAEDAAKALGCSRVHLLNVEQGRDGASFELIAKMMQVYGASETEIRVSIRKSRVETLRRQLRKEGK